MIIALRICEACVESVAVRALARTLASAGKRSPIRIAMIATTTKSSTKVKARDLDFILDIGLCPFNSILGFKGA